MKSTIEYSMHTLVILTSIQKIVYTVYIYGIYLYLFFTKKYNEVDILSIFSLLQFCL